MRKSIYSEEQRAIQTLLIQLRKERGLRQIDLAEKLGMSQQFVSRYEEGQKVLDLPELGQICRALSISLAEFVRMYETRLEGVKRKVDEQPKVPVE